MPELTGQVRFSASVLTLFYRQLQMLLEAGFPIDQALRILERNELDDVFAGVLLELERKICHGSSLSQAMSFFPGVFSPVVIALVRAGEESGGMVRAFDMILGLTERAERVRRRLRAAFAYPSVVLILTAAISLIAVYFVIPQERAVWESQNLELPAFTTLVVGGLEILLNPFTLVVLVAVFVLLVRLARSGVVFPSLRDLLLHIPVLGPILEQLAWARVLHSMSCMIRAGLTFGRGMASVGRSAGFVVLETRYSNFIRAIAEEGLDLQEAAEASGAFTPLVRQFLVVAEYDSSDVLGKVATLLDSNCEQALDSLASLLEPLTLVVTGLVIGSIVVALFLPTAQIVSNL